MDDMKKMNNGDVVFVAFSVSDYELLAYNMQELRRYIREVQEVVVYYRNVTIKNPDGSTSQGQGSQSSRKIKPMSRYSQERTNITLTNTNYIVL